MKYKNLLRPIRVGDLIIKNRLMYPNASPHFLQGPEDYPAEGYRAFVANLARNGAGIISVAEWDDPNQRNFPADLDMSHMQSFDTRNPAVHNYLSQLAEEVHFYGSKLLISLRLVYPEGYTLNGGRAMMPGGAETSERMPLSMIPDAIARNVELVRFYKLLGFDGVDLRCDMEMLPKPGEREDEYGGSLEHRTRFLREFLTEVKHRFGGSFIIHGTIAWEQPDGYGPITRIGGGYTEREAEEFIRLTEGIIDIMEIRENNVCTSHPTGYTMTEGEHPALDFCARLKAKGCRMLLEPIGGFQDPDEMEAALAEGKCDFFGAARAFMADYQYGAKLYEGRGEDIVPCIRCNKCHGTILPEHEPWLSVCSVNPVMGKWGKLARLLGAVGSTGKKVAVIGGGPAGMRAALMAAELGHSVTLFEKTDRLGGQLFHSDYFSFKWPVRNYKNWLIAQLKKSTVQVVLNTAPDPDAIEAAGYDAVLAATGAVPAVPRGIEGLHGSDGTVKEGVLTCLDAIPLERELGKSIIIVGGSEVGMETAMFLCENGHEVTVLTRQQELGHNCSKLHYITMAWIKPVSDSRAVEAPAWERYHNLHGIVRAETLRVDGNTVTYRDDQGELRTITGDRVLICGGMTNQTDEAMKYAGRSVKYFAIGDCVGAGSLQMCTEQAYSSVMNL